MKQLLLVILVIALGACNRPEEPTTTRGKLFMLVTQSHLPLMKEEAAEFTAEYSKTSVEMAGTTTREAIVAMLNDSVQCICVDRQLNAEEKSVVEKSRLRVSPIRIGRDALVLLVNQENTVKKIKLKTIKGIIEGSISSWRKVPGSSRKGDVELVLTGKNSGVYELLQRRFFHLSKELALSKIGDTEKQIVDYIGVTPNALGIVSLAAVVGHPNGVHLLAVESADSLSSGMYVDPSQQNVYEELYPLTYSLYLYLSEERLGVGSGFSTFVMTLMGQKIIQDYGLAPEIVPSRIIQLKSE
jgi:phosphate transport system substrate-binding protein